LDEKNFILSCYVPMGQSLSHLLVDSLFSPKDRRPFLHSKELRKIRLGLRPPISAALARPGRDGDLPRAKEAPDFAKPTSRLAFWRHIPAT